MSKESKSNGPDDFAREFIDLLRFAGINAKGEICSKKESGRRRMSMKAVSGPCDPTNFSALIDGLHTLRVVISNLSHDAESAARERDEFRQRLDHQKRFRNSED